MVAASAQSPWITVALSLTDPIAPADIPLLCSYFIARLSATGARAVTCDAGGLDNPDATTIDALARLHLTARRHGCALRLQHAPGQLLDLLALAGLSDVIEVGAPSTIQPGRKIEQGEQAWLHEVVQSGDTPC
jgi:ABC-type transporter Mla MlaB component